MPASITVAIPLTPVKTPAANVTPATIVIAKGIPAVGSMVLGAYHTTGQYKAAKYGQKYLGKGYKKAGYTNSGTPRYVSKDGLRQMRFDAPHMYKGKMIGKHLNLESFKGTKPVPYEHVLYSLFKYWIL